MKAKNGFSLMELLLIMVILAILAILIYPRVLNSYKKAKKDTFLTEAKRVYVDSFKKYSAAQMRNEKLNTIN